MQWCKWCACCLHRKILQIKKRNNKQQWDFLLEFYFLSRSQHLRCAKCCCCGDLLNTGWNIWGEKKVNFSLQRTWFRNSGKFLKSMFFLLGKQVIFWLNWQEDIPTNKGRKRKYTGLKDVIGLFTRVQDRLMDPGWVRPWGKAAQCELPKPLKPALAIFVVISVGKIINL